MVGYFVVGLVSMGASPLVITQTEAFYQKLYEDLAPSVVFITTQSELGSGFFVGNDGLILTNAHVVDGRSQVDVVTFAGQRHVGRVVERAANNVDLALVQVQGITAPNVQLGKKSAVRVGSFVAAVGHGSGTLWTFNTGMVSNVYPVGKHESAFQTQMPLNPGCSGGPVVNVEGQVVGVVTSGVRSASSLNFAIAIDVACRSLQGMRPHCAL